MTFQRSIHVFKSSSFRYFCRNITQVMKQTLANQPHIPFKSVSCLTIAFSLKSRIQTWGLRRSPETVINLENSIIIIIFQNFHWIYIIIYIGILEIIFKLCIENLRKYTSNLCRLIDILLNLCLKDIFQCATENNTFFMFTKVLEAQVNLVSGWHGKNFQCVKN